MLTVFAVFFFQDSVLFLYACSAAMSLIFILEWIYIRILFTLCNVVYFYSYFLCVFFC